MPISREWWKVLWLLYLGFLGSFELKAQNDHPDIAKDKNGEIVLLADSLGNTIPDFSYCGYKASEEAIPHVELRIFVPHIEEDATEKIQQALDFVGSLKANSDGFKGTVLLDSGTFKVDGTLYMRESGVVLRGSGYGNDGTILLGTGIRREAMIRVLGTNDRQFGDTLHLADKHIPLGAKKITVPGDLRLKVGDEVVVRKPLTEQWITELKMEEFGGETDWIGWKPKDWDISWERTIEKVDGKEVVLSAPLTMSLDPRFGKMQIIPYHWSGRIAQVGIENLELRSTYDPSNKKDEQHRWLGISMENVENAWVRQATFKHFAGGAISLLKSTRMITVEDCLSLAPVSEIAAFRRHSFYTEGQQTLFQRCYSEYGYHDFAVGGFGTSGPNAFVQCTSNKSQNVSGAVGSWATGVLFDVVKIDGQALSFKNREQDGRGAGWTASNSVIWESSASKVENYSPPTAQNWAFGVWGQFAGNGYWKEANNHINPKSIYYALLEKRMGKLPADPQLLDMGSEASTSPTLEMAAQLTELARSEAPSLKVWIESAAERNPIPVDPSYIPTIGPIAKKSNISNKNGDGKIEIKNGKLVFNGKLLTGKRTDVMWWRGSLRDDDIQKASPHITRFVPGRRGQGLTDDLNDVVRHIEKNNISALEHNYGLWYDRRMDDHERVRRIDADTWPPFYEQPFNRSGKELAWDHLSKYDLTEFNDWYWWRLQRFAGLAESKGKILIHQQYFQHNILEAGAHWSSSPWRSANNINDTGFPEPPPYAGDKRIFMDEQFYAIDHRTRKKLHQMYIRKAFENFKEQSNVIQLTSAEYTGPLHFMKFWLDEAQQWEKDTGKEALIGLSATKDVQDAVLDDSLRSKIVDVIDIRYWYYKEDGSSYAPEGGKHLAPRQHARKMDTGKETEEQVYRAIREYHEKYPEKAVLYSTPASGNFGWAQLMAGASLPAIPDITLSGFYENISEMGYSEQGKKTSDENWILENRNKSLLIYKRQEGQLEIDLRAFSGSYQIYYIDEQNGNVEKGHIVRGGRTHKIEPKKKIIYIIR